MPSPFYVEPAGNASQGLSGLSSVLQGIGEQKAARLEKEAAEAADRQLQTEAAEVLNSEDPNLIAQFSLQNPKMAQQLQASMGIKEKYQKDELKGFLTEVLAAQTPEEIDAAYQKRAAGLQAQGRDPTHTMNSYAGYQQDPERAMRGNEIQLALNFPDEFAAYQKVKASKAAPAPYTDFAKANQDLAAGLITPEQHKALTTPDQKRDMREDANGVLRYTDDGNPVFPEVQKVAATLEDKDRFDKAKVLRTELNAANKGFQDIANSWDRITASANDPSPAGDLGLIFNYMKMLDPGSTVREGEFATAQQTAGIDQRIVGAYNKALEGTRLTPEQRADYFNQGQHIFNASSERAKAIEDSYVRLGERAGLERDDIVISRGQDPSINQGAVSQTATDAGVTPEEWALMSPQDKALFP